MSDIRTYPGVTLFLFVRATTNRTAVRGNPKMAWSISARSTWTAPPSALSPLATAARKLVQYERERHFQLLTREFGSERDDLPIWVSAANTVRFDKDPPVVKRTEVPDVPGAFVLSDVCSPDECDQLLRISEAMGYTQDAPVSLGRDIRRNENCVWIADDSLWRPLWQRVEKFMPAGAADGTPAGLNQRWRLYRYGPDDIFRMHTDGSWPGSGVRDGKLVRDIYRDRWSRLTFLLYLDDEYQGGETTFMVPEQHGLGGPRQATQRSVRVPRGSVLCFYHGEHELSMLHEGSLVTQGVKHIVRSDVLYTPATCSAGAAMDD